MLSENKKILIIAHRGASKLTPENTLKAFNAAIDLGADYIEFDVRCSADGKLVIIHDNCTLRTTHKLKWINRMNLVQIKKLNAGEGERIPTLEELIEHTKGKVKYMCEIKIKGIIEKVVKILKEGGVVDSTILISFKHNELLKIQNHYPKLKMSAIVPSKFGWISSWLFKKRLILSKSKDKFYAINPFYFLVNKKFLNLAQKKNLRVFPWTVNTKRFLKKLINMEVTGILTDDIIKAKELINSKK
ncbi:MAG: glycerophosphodiester phosphodiesterase [Promethearchaeota archaeon]|nr:MAG: glycerophosphodiester phosphodiesterase [Candidatus Lokiarchaeota archaeon]